MIFRRTRSSSGWRTWLILVLLSLILGSVLSLELLAVHPATPIVRRVFVGLSVFLGLPIAMCVRGIVFPREWEVVVDSASIRWGASTKPERQKSVRIEQVRRIINDENSHRILADTGGWIKPSIGPLVLSHADRRSFVQFFVETFPDVKVETRHYRPPAD